MDWLPIPDSWKPWKWPEYFMKWLRGFQEVREAKHKADKAQAEASEANNRARASEAKLALVEWEAKVAEMKRKIRKLQNEVSAANRGRNIVPEIQAGPDDDIEVFNEAMRQIRDESRRR